MVYTYNGILTYEKNEVLMYPVAWVNLRNIMLGRESQIQKPYTVFHFNEMCGIGKSIQTEMLVVARGLGREGWRMT